MAMGYFRGREKKWEGAIIRSSFRRRMYLRRHENSGSEIIKCCITGVVQGMRPEKLELDSKAAFLSAQMPIEMKI